MSNTVIKVENVGKLYRLGQIGTGTIGQDFNRWLSKVRGKEDPFALVGEENDRTVKGNTNYVWALKEINFEVSQGEILGIIGRNGAGKSTILKLLSKVTKPSVGSIKLKGRIASLLEVGTGFHPDLTGKENVFLNGAILGMTKKEIKKKFDEIVDFSGVERYIDTPVKRYSSGMYVRLAFAVAAHLESEILIIDEVLAVGDSQFQKKCLGKMDEVGRGGRTVLYVSHALGTLAQLCKTSIWLSNGHLQKKGSTELIIDDYLRSQTDERAFYTVDLNDVKEKDAFFVYQKMVDEQGSMINEITNNDPVILEIKIAVQRWQEEMELGLSLQHRIKGRIFTVHIPIRDLMTPYEKEKTIQFKIPSNVIIPNRYSWISAIHIPNSKSYDVLWDECAFSINDAGTEFARYEGVDYGVFNLNNYEIKVK